MIQQSINQAISLSGLLLQTNPAFQEFRMKQAEEAKKAGIRGQREKLAEDYEKLANLDKQTGNTFREMEELDKADLALSQKLFEMDPTANTARQVVQGKDSVEAWEDIRQEERAKQQAKQAEIEYQKGIEEQNRQRARIERQQAEKAARMGLGFSAEDYLAAPSLLKKTLEGGY